MSGPQQTDPEIPYVAEHDTWISIDPIIGCPANCSYCYLWRYSQKGRVPTIRASPTEMVRLLQEYLDDTRADTTHTNDCTPVCIGNHTDMLMTETNRNYLLEFAELFFAMNTGRPLVVVSKGRMDRPLAERLEILGGTTLVFHSQSFYRSTHDVRIEKGPILTPDQTFRTAAAYTDLHNVKAIHFWRPITAGSVPSTQWAHDTISQLRSAGFLCSVAIGLAIGPGVDQDGMADLGLLDRSAAAVGEVWDAGAWTAIASAAKLVGYPVYRSTSCAIALATKQVEALGVWDDQRGASLRCKPCACPEAQRSRCGDAVLHSSDLTDSVRWISQRVHVASTEMTILPGRRVRIPAKVNQATISLALHKYCIELVPDGIEGERAWLGRFGRQIDIETT